ncbi:MAG: hypothetical protein JST26_05730 [Bacteroidetes bacterium]|nr:hypothetical protein [Bacteroidota bacterium]
MSHSTWKLGMDSYHKLIVWFVDGNVRTRYSIDWRSRFSQTRDPQLGLERFYKCIGNWGAKAKVVEIYVNSFGTKTGAAIERYEFGVKTEFKVK